MRTTASASRTCTDTASSPPESVYFDALASRFTNTCSRRPGIERQIQPVTPALPEETEEVRLPVGRLETTVDRQDHSIDKNGVLTCEKRDHTRDLLWGGGSAN